MLKAVILDFDQTVVNSAEGFRTAEHWLQRMIFEFLQLPEWESFINVYRSFRGVGPADTPESKCEQWKDVCRHFKKEADEERVLQWKEGYWGRVESGSKLFPEALSVLTRLKTDFRLGLLTNASAPEGKSLRLDRFPELYSIFDAVRVCGGKELPLKPDPTGFRRILEDLGVSAEEAIFVGDDLDCDVSGARAVGLCPVWLRHHTINWKRQIKVPNELIQIDSLEPLALLDSADSIATAQRKLHRE